MGHHCCSLAGIRNYESGIREKKKPLKKRVILVLAILTQLLGLFLKFHYEKSKSIQQERYADTSGDCNSCAPEINSLYVWL